VRASAVALLVCSIAMPGCGARTGLVLEEPTPGDGGERDAEPDGRPGDAAAEATPDGEASDGRIPVAHCTDDAECSDGVSCTVDRCDQATGTCTHTPDNARCPPGFACRPPCEAASFAEDSLQLYGVDLPAGAVASVGHTGFELDDIALDPGGTLYGAARDGHLCVVDTKTGESSWVAWVGLKLNALDFAPDGTLYGAVDTNVYKVDKKTGATHLLVSYPDPYTSSGDLAIIGRRLLATVHQGRAATIDALLSVDLDSLQIEVIGSLGHGCVFGLAAYGDRLFGYTCDGLVLRIDPKTAASTVLAETGIAFFGASAR
jgi:hypothetical protein